MKDIINGKRYNTETAEEIARYYYGAYGDFEYFDETLYRTAKGNWFLAGSGGPNSKYAEYVGAGSRSGGSAIIPMTDDEAYEWLEEYSETSAIEEYFSDRV